MKRLERPVRDDDRFRAETAVLRVIDRHHDGGIRPRVTHVQAQRFARVNEQVQERESDAGE
jgi:hypothetical protein